MFDVLTQNHSKLRGWPTPWLSFRPYVYVGMDNYNLRTRRLPACVAVGDPSVFVAVFFSWPF